MREGQRTVQTLEMSGAPWTPDVAEWFAGDFL